MMTPHQRLLHETIIRALQMIINVWKKYLESEDKLIEAERHKREQLLDNVTDLRSNLHD